MESNISWQSVKYEDIEIRCWLNLIAIKTTIKHCKLYTGVLCAEKYLQKYQETSLEKILWSKKFAAIHCYYNPSITIKTFHDCEHLKKFAKIFS